MNYEEEIANKQEYIENLSINVQYVNSDEVAEGYVISQDPKEQMVKVKSIVKLEVSSGPKEIDIPQVSENEHKETVRDKLEKAGFVVKEVKQSSDTVAADNVIKTSPSYPDKAVKGDVITMFVSTGKEQVPDVTVRNMKGVDVSTAVDQLTDLGLTVDPEYTYVNSNSYTSRGIVVDQTPAGETSVSPGTQVKLTLSSGYRDVTIPLALPMEATTGVDVQVYVDGTLDQELSKTGLLPSDIKTLNLEIKNVQKAEYSVTIQISPTGANRYTRFASFRVNGSTGSITTEYLNPYEDPYATTTTSSTTNVGQRWRDDED